MKAKVSGTKKKINGTTFLLMITICCNVRSRYDRI